MRLAEGVSWLNNIPSSQQRNIWYYMQNGGSDIAIHFLCNELEGDYLDITGFA